MDTSEIFANLKSILQPYEPPLSVVHNKSDHYYLNTPTTETNRKAEFFGAVQIKKSYVSYHLMPVYYYPELLSDISPELRNRMQGKSCFNFKTKDDLLLTELSSLTKTSFNKYKFLNKI